MTRAASRDARRGTTLIEALVASALTAVGMLALLRGESTLRLHADLTRERAEAVRTAQSAIEQLRDYGSLADYGALAALPADETVGLASNTEFTLHRELALHEAPRYLLADVSVSWRDRQGQPASVWLSSAIAEADPMLSGRLAMPPSPPARSAPLGRDVTIPMSASELGDGRSAWRPPGSASAVWVFDDASGRALQVCDDGVAGALHAEQLGDCQAVSALLVSGEVRFATGAAIGVTDALLPSSPALALAMHLDLTEGDAPASSCFAESAGASTPTTVHYACLVAVDAHTRHWSGRLDVQPLGWVLGHAADTYRVCRYSDDADRDGTVRNAEHPLDYAAVATALAAQNFLVVRGDNACPTDTPADPTQGHFVDANTVEQAPTPTATPVAAP
jgi:hypothetical protein